ncbi:MAG: GvpL/GvpF family gas vesicle protein [Chloroflexales bacterium]|nr:GvpL/GvpF family gas vesicle protein [Chloroflexales bacterium]
MSRLYLYAIVDRTDQGLPAVAGLGGAALIGLPAGDLLAVVSEAGADQVPLNRDNLLHHEAVIEALMDGRGVLPARFGTMADQPRLAEALGRHEAAFTRTIERVRGRVELALRVIDTHPAEEPVARPRRAEVASGRGYMQALLEAERGEGRRRETAEAIAARITAELTPLADAAVYERAARPKLLLKAAYLLRRELLTAMRERIQGLQTTYPSLTFLATGPWPAYSFAEVEQGSSLFDHARENLI